jgi:hypothetical protein
MHCANCVHVDGIQYYGEWNMLSVISKCLELSRYGLFGIICVSNAACVQSRPSAQQPGDAPMISAIEAALENPVLKCEQDQATCVGAAKDPAAAAQCSSSFRECLGGAAEVGQQLAEAVQQCRDTAAECAVKAGPSGAASCTSGYESCVSAVTADPAPPAAGAPSLPQLPSAGSGGSRRLPTAGGISLPMRSGPLGGAGIGGGLPRLPSAGGLAIPGGLGGLPNPRAGLPSTACFEQLQMCAQAPNADLNKCAAAARSCLTGAVGPSAPTGAGGAAGAP